MVKSIIKSNETKSQNKDEIAVLKELFPSCFSSEGKFDFELFKGKISNSIEITNEGYELNFLGKKYSKMLASLDTTTVIIPDEEHNNKKENKTSNNVYISGDNLDGLKHLLKSYEGLVKCIYIDPPYNTGADDFSYNDSFNFTAEELSIKLSIELEEAERILELTKRNSASHSAWLMFMLPRLLLARDLLKKDGVIFISIDDNEQANLKLLCDDVFGENNFIASIIVQANKRGQTYKQLAKTHEYLLVYSRSAETVLNEFKKAEGSFNNADDIGEFEERELRNRNPKFGRFNRPNLFYPIYANPNEIDASGFCPVSLEKSDLFSVKIEPYNSEGEESCWRWGTTKFERNNNSTNSMLSDVVAKKKTTGEYGVYEKYRKDTFKAKTIWYMDDIVGELVEEDDDIWEETGVITEQGTKELKALGMADTFDFPKPTFLIKKILNLGGDENSLFVDFFSGSGTSLASILKLNADDGECGKRKIIVIQLPENLDTKIENITEQGKKKKIQKIIDFLDKNNRPHSLDYVGIERIIRTAKTIKESVENPEKLDLGFKHYILQEPSKNTLDKLEAFDEKALLQDNSILADFGKNTVLTTWMIHDGLGFNPDIKEIDLNGYKAHWCENFLYLIDPDLSDKSIEALIVEYESNPKFNPRNIVIFGYSFTWTELESLKINLKRLKDTEKNLRVTFDIRY